MRLLIDSHVLVWVASNDRRLSTRALALITDIDNFLAVSVASLWELEIKRAKGGLVMPASPREGALILGAELLAITADDAEAAAALPRHHGDPFDRMIIAQASTQGLTVITSDDALTAYDVPVIPA